MTWFANLTKREFGIGFCLIFCLNNAFILIGVSGVPIPGGSPAEYDDVSDKFDQNLSEHAHHVPQPSDIETYFGQATQLHETRMVMCPICGKMVEAFVIPTANQDQISGTFTTDVNQNENSREMNEQGINLLKENNNAKGYNKIETPNDQQGNKNEVIQNPKLNDPHNVVNKISNIPQLDADKYANKNNQPQNLNNPNTNERDVIKQENDDDKSPGKVFDTKKSNQQKILDDLLKSYQGLKRNEIEDILNRALKVANAEEKEGIEDELIYEKEGKKKDYYDKLYSDRLKEAEELKNLSPTEKRIRRQHMLNRLALDHRTLKKILKNEIDNPPGLKVDTKRRDDVMRIFKNMGRERKRRVFEVSVSRHYNEKTKNLDNNAKISFTNVDLNEINKKLKKTNNPLRRKPNFRNKDFRKSMVANMKIKPMIGVHHSETSYLTNTPYRWKPVPNHYEYLGLIETPPKYLKSDFDQILLANYDPSVLKKVREDMYGGPVLRITNGANLKRTYEIQG